MNSTIENFTRQSIKDALKKCTEPQQLVFKKMYSHKDLDLPIDKVVDKMPVGKLDWALTQVEQTNKKYNQ
jgi:hypothetical protein